jgi:hypothetical protein
MHLYEARPRKDHRGVDPISDALPFGRLWYDTPDDAVATRPDSQGISGPSKLLIELGCPFFFKWTVDTLTTR